MCYESPFQPLVNKNLEKYFLLFRALFSIFQVFY